MAYSIAIPSALTSALLTCVFQLKLSIGADEPNPEEQEQNEELEGVLLFDIPIPLFLQ